MAADNVEKIARICHEANRAYCQAIGDHSQPSWLLAPEWQKQSAIQGVQFHIERPDADPRASHENWLYQKRLDGWSYGEVKGPERKQHPCFLPYDSLPVEQKAKDFIFRAIVHAATAE